MRCVNGAAHEFSETGADIKPFIFRTTIYAILATLLLSANDRAVFAGELTGTWKFSSSNSKAVFFHDGNKITGWFENSAGTQFWDFKGTINAQGKLRLIRYIPDSEFLGHGMSEAEVAWARTQIGSDRAGFLQGDVELTHDKTANTLDGHYVYYGSTRDAATKRLESIDKKINKISMRPYVPAIRITQSDFKTP